VSVNGRLLFSLKNIQFPHFIKAAATHFKTDYPKFYKMDNLSKLALLSADILLKGNDKNEDTAILLFNRASSLDSDRKHQAAISDPENFYPSPSVFVYTLPNICIGEICIKHHLHSENAFFVFDTFNPKHLFFNADYLLKQNKATQALCGWVDFDDKNYEAFLYLVSENGIIAHQQEEIERIYHSHKSKATND